MFKIDDYYVYEYWYPAEEDLPIGLDRVLVMDTNGRASGNAAEATQAPKKPDNLVLMEVTTSTTTTQPERVKRADKNVTTTSPKPEINKGWQSLTTTTPVPIASTKLVIKSEIDAKCLNKPGKLKKIKHENAINIFQLF